MLLKKHAEISIRNSPEAIWDFAQDPINWTASNPEEHKGLEFFNENNRPETGSEFYQKELVAGFYADLKGRILYADRPWVCAWTGVARYKFLGGLLKVRIPEGGLVKIDKRDDSCLLTHDVFMEFPDTLRGKILLWIFKKIFRGDEAVYRHTYRELAFFKERLDKG